MRSDGCGTGLTGMRRGHLNIVLSRDRWGNETPLNWCNRAVGLAPECSTAIVTDSPARVLGPEPASGRGSVSGRPPPNRWSEFESPRWRESALDITRQSPPAQALPTAADPRWR